MRFYRVSEDWITYFEGDFRQEILATLRGLDLARLQKYPPPKINGLPFGNETRVLGRFLKGKSSQLDASAASSFYRSFMSAEDKLLYRAFRENASLSRGEWSSIIGDENVDRWLAAKSLKEIDGGLRCQFSVIGIDNLVFTVDHMKDHGPLWEPDYLVEEKTGDGPNIQPFFHTYMGLDSLQMIEAMEASGLIRPGKRYLDCGPGSGSLLLYFSRRFEEAVGIDINSRAAKLAQFNADLNSLGNVKTYFDDALALGDRYGKFDLVSWNLPFIFMPQEHEDEFIDGFGGEMGIGLCLAFVETLPAILSKGGMACVAALAPILNSGENVLEARLKDMLPRLKLDSTVQVAQVSLAHSRDQWHFHQSHNIRKFESVYLYLTEGTGKLERVEAPASRRLIDTVREKMYARKYA